MDAKNNIKNNEVMDVEVFWLIIYNSESLFVYLFECNKNLCGSTDQHNLRGRYY